MVLNILIGNLEMKNLYLRYNSNEDNYVLKNINFIVNDGEKIGIVGRTGAGKSSIIAALFRFIYISLKQIKCIPN